MILVLVYNQVNNHKCIINIIQLDENIIKINGINIKNHNIKIKEINFIIKEILLSNKVFYIFIINYRSL